MASAPQKVLLSWAIDDTGKTGQVMFDCSLNEQHGATAEVTRHQTEKGIPSTDYIRPMPRTLVLEEVVTNTPIDLPSTQADGVSGSVQEVSLSVNGQEVKFSVFKFDGPLDRVRDVFGDLVDAVQASALFTATTTLARYENYAITSVSVPRDASKGQALYATIELTQVRIVESQTVQALPPKTQPKKRGAKTGKQLDSKTDEQKVSVASKLMTAIRGAFK